VIGSNRTIVGLKRLTALHYRRWLLWQQSHHCGIETCLNRASKGLITAQQSHHCGIETGAAQLQQLLFCRSNRTIVGLKLR